MAKIIKEYFVCPVCGMETDRGVRKRTKDGQVLVCLSCYKKSVKKEAQEIKSAGR